MKRTYKKKSNLINKTGYTPGYDTEKNPVNYIPSEDITMANTPYPLYATPLDENGNPIGKGMIMQPGGEYKFPNAAYVAETPIFAKGGEKSAWISNKISTLVKEGYPQKQAVAIAYSMYENRHSKGGYQLPMYQLGTGSFDPNKPTPEALAAYEEQQKKAQDMGISISDFDLGDETSGMTNPELMPASAQLNFNKIQNTATNNYDENGNAKDTSNPLDIKGSEPFQFFNPYSGFDIPTAASTLGSSIESGDTLGTVASGLKLATGLTRNFFGGMGQERRKNYLEKQYYEKQREGMTGAGREQMLEFGGYYQDGGMEEPQGGDIQQQVAQALQQGMSPEEVMQQLVQMGMPEDQAVALIQGIMQQMQPSTPQLKRGGMMYYQKGGEEGEENEEEYEDEEEPNYMINKPSLMGKQQNFSEPKEGEEEEYEVEKEDTEDKTPSYDKNSARDTWVAKTGLPWSEAKRLGYTDGSAKDNMKLLSELNDPRFNKEYLRKRPISPAKSNKKSYTQEELWGKPFTNPLQDYISNMGKATPTKVKKAENIPFNTGQNNPIFIGNQFPLPVGAKAVKEPESRANWEIYKENITNWLNKNAPAMFQPRAYQDGGEQQVAQQVAQAMQQGMQPQEAMSMLMESGMTEDQALQMVQAIMEQLQQQTETPQLRKGGEMIKRADGSYSRRGLWDNIRENRGSGKKPTKEMLEQEAKIKREYQEGGMEPGADPTEMIMQQVAQMLDQGADPQQIVQMLVEAGVPEEQAVQMVEAVMQQSEQMPEMRDGGIPERYKKMGFTKVGAKKKSTRPGKKWMVLAKKEDQYKIVHGGDSNMKDFSQHGSEERKDRFWNRMGGRDSAKANDPFSPLYWHKKFGTWQEGGEMMDEEMEGEDETMENESAMLEQIESQVEQALKQGADPQQIMEQLIQMGIPQEVAQQMIEEILQEIEGGETEMEEPEEGTPQMSKGGKYMRALVGKTIKNYTYNPKTDSYIVNYE